MRRLHFALALVAMGITGFVPCCLAAEDTAKAPVVPPPKAEDNAPAPKPEAATPGVAPGRDPAGLLRFPGGTKVKIGIPRKAFQEHVAATAVGRMGKLAAELIERELSPCVGEHEVTLPVLWIGKYEVTNAQYHLFLQQAARVEIEIAAPGKPGYHTLDEIARAHAIYRMRSRGRETSIPAVTWEGLYDINAAVLAPADKKDNPPRETFEKRQLPAGTKIVAYRWTVPVTWKVAVKSPDGKERLRLQDSPPPGTGDLPVTFVSLLDAMACARWYGCHIPTEDEWEACARGPKGEIGAFDPISLAWGGFNGELERAKEAAGKKDAAKRTPRDVWALAANALPDPPPDPALVPVGSFPLGATPWGALDMLGNADEWVATRLYPYPGTDSKSVMLSSRGQVQRGGYFADKDTLLSPVTRKFLDEHGNPFNAGQRFTSCGFRMARYDLPGVSLVPPAVVRALDSDPPILPAERDPRTFTNAQTGLDLYGAVGIELLDEVSWKPSGSPANDPPEKVFHRGEAHGLALVPPDIVPFKDVAAVKRAADGNRLPAEDAHDKRRPRALPFLGLLYATPKMELKGTVRVAEMKEVPLSAREQKAVKDEWDARERQRQKEKEEREKAAKEGEKKDDGGAKDDGGTKDDGGDKKQMPAGDEKKKDDKKKDDPKKKGGKADPKGGSKPADPPPADPAAPPPADAPAEEPAEEEEEPVAPMPTTKKVEVISWRPGVVKASDFPNGFLLGWMVHEGERRPALWEARQGAVPVDAPGGLVLLEPPCLILDKDALDIKKRPEDLPATSEFDDKIGDLKLVVLARSETKGDAFEITLRLRLAGYPEGNPGMPWRSTLGNPASKSDK